MNLTYCCARHGDTLGNGSTSPRILYHAARRKRVVTFHAPAIFWPGKFRSVN